MSYDLTITVKLCVFLGVMIIELRTEVLAPLSLLRRPLRLYSRGALPMKLIEPTLIMLFCERELACNEVFRSSWMSEEMT